MITESKVIEIYSLADDFCKVFSSYLKKYQFNTPRALANIIATRRHCPIGSFFEFKLHLICNEQGSY